MKLVLKLGQTIEDCKRILFNQGYSYEDSKEMVRLVFEETGLKFSGFLELDKQEIKDTIKHLELNFLT